MKNSINLYTEDFRPKLLWNSLDNIAAASGLLLGIMIIWGSVIGWQHDSVDDEIAKVTTELNQVRQEAQLLDQRLAAHQPDPKLTRLVESKKSELQGMQLLLTQLNTLVPERDQRFGQLMYDLAALSSDRLALSEIIISYPDITLRGVVAESKDLPDWVSRFNTTQSLGGKQFDVLTLDRDDKGVLSFTLQTRHNQEKRGSAR